MLLPGDSSQALTCRLIVIQRAGPRVLLVAGSSGLALPSVDGSPSSRLAEVLTAQARALSRCEGIYLSTLDSSREPWKGQNYRLLECIDPANDPCSLATWKKRSELSADRFIDLRDYEAIQLTLDGAGSGHGHVGPFSRLGWFDELKSWVNHAIQPLGMTLTGRFRQLNGSATFSLIQLETTGAAVWFKAVGEPNLREFGLIQLLSKRIPEYVAPAFAVRPEWNGWISLEAAGYSLESANSPEPWYTAANCLARLQIASIERREEWLAWGARDARNTALSKLLDPFFKCAAELMKQQHRTPPPVVSPSRMHELRAGIEEALALVDALDLPEALGHLDLNAGNVIVQDDQCVFLDWAEGYYGCPFLSFEYLLEHFRRAASVNAHSEREFSDSYWEPWKCAFGEKRLAEARRIIPLLAVFNYAVHYYAWRSGSPLDDRASGYLRSLTRRMEAEAQHLSGEIFIARQR